MGDTVGNPVRFLFFILKDFTAGSTISFRIPFVQNPASQVSLTAKYKLVHHDSSLNLGIPLVLAEYSFKNHQETNTVSSQSKSISYTTASSYA
jgi:hypothetical protein